MTIINLKKYSIDSPITQGVVVGSVGAVLNRVGVMSGNAFKWSPFETTLVIELVIPFICTFVICLMFRQKFKHCFYMSSFASIVGVATTMLTFNWD